MNGITATYTLDLAAGLTQVLADGTNTYLYGVGRVGEQKPTGWQYHLGDALGSVRQLADDTAAVTLVRAYEPYGDTLSSAGAGDSAYAYVGEWRDATGLVHLRARYLSTSDGRFVSKDIWDGEPSRPESYNAWLYAYADPLNLTDPSGKWPSTASSPALRVQDLILQASTGPALGIGRCRVDRQSEVDNDDRDLTDWLVREMRANAASGEVDTIRRFNVAGNVSAVGGAVASVGLTITAGPGGTIVGGLAEAGAASFKLAAYLNWRDLVKDGARWDFKDQIRAELRESIRLCDDAKCRWFEYSVPGNIHYAYVGRAAGFTTFELHAGATVAQQIDPENVPRENAWHGDQPTDFQAIEMGARIFGSCGRNPGLTCFGTALRQYKSTLALGVPPLEPYFSPYGTAYPLGHFDGDGMP